VRTLCLLILSVALPAQPAKDLWTAIEPIYAKTLQHPFLTGLTDGTLPKERFTFYLQQDAAYLDAFSQALLDLSQKAPDKQWAQTLRRHAKEAIAAEKKLPPAPMAPTNYAYVNHFRHAVATGTFAEGLASLLPCYWIYQEVGRELVRKGSKNAKSVAEVLAMYNTAAPKLTPAQRANAKDLFIKSARYEYQFWDMAFRQEPWLP